MSEDKKQDKGNNKEAKAEQSSREAVCYKMKV